MKKTLMILAAAAGTAAFAATKGSCESAAVSLAVGKSATVKLTAEFDETYDEDSGVYYFSTTLSRGASYTLTLSGADAEYADIDAYPREPTDKEWDADIMGPSATFTYDNEYGGVYVNYMESDEWDMEEDPKSWKYYIKLSGNVGDTVTVSLVSGIVSYKTPGTEDNPMKLTMSDSENSRSYSFVDGEYYFSAQLKAGRLYRVRTAGGTSSAPVELNVDSTALADFDMISDSSYSADTNNTAVIIAPKEDGTFVFTASGTGSSFGLVWQSIPTRSISAHPSTPLNAANGHSVTFTPGRVISSYSYADDIIDEHLCSIAIAKGERWVFDTAGATTESRMVLYDSKGNILASNDTKGNSSYDLRIAYEAKTTGTYYVGVCEQSLGVDDEASGAEITLTAINIAAPDKDPDEWDAIDDTASGATPLSPLPGTDLSDPITEGSAHGPHRLSMTDWSDCFQIGARKNITYVLTAVQSGEETTDLALHAKVFTLSGSTEKEVEVSGGIDPLDDKPLTFTANANTTYYIRVSVAEGQGLDYPDYTVYALAYSTGADQLGILTVNTPGAPTATWSLGSETTKYVGGASVLVSGTQTIKFSSVSGYKSAIASTNVTVNPGTEPTVVEVKYSDTFDPKDDVAAGATAITLKNVDTPYATRTLWEGDVDNFAIAGTDGYFYDLAIRGAEGDGVVFSIINDDIGPVVENATSVSQLELPKTKAKYIVSVHNFDDAKSYGGYTLAGKFANVGTIKFAKNAVSAKENAATVKLTVNRTAKDGYVRVKYGTVAGTAQPGVDYVPQSGVIEWTDGDNKAKTIEISLIPDLVAVYEGTKTFSVQLKAFDEDERSAGEYAAAFPIGMDKCVVTLTETARPTDTVESAYAKKAPKLATVKTEQVGLETGTFFGLLSEDGSALTNGFPSMASVTLTASTSNPAKLSAKVALAGKNYTFAATGWDEGEEEDTVSRELQLVQKVNRLDEGTGRSVSVTVTNVLTVTVASGATGTPDDWMRAGGIATLVMNVPDANNKGYQEEIVYRGFIYRNNAKIQDYLTAVTNFTGYYTVALAPSAVSASDGIPAGNGYVTLTIDNKGTVKAAGMLADGATKPSLSVAACALVPDEASANGYSMRVPLYFAKSPVVFGGDMRLYADESGTVVVDSSEQLVWKNDNAALTYSGEEGYSIDLDPVGGFYDTIINLQTHYLNCAFQVETGGIDEFPEENLAAGYVFSTDVEPNETTVKVAGDAFATDKKVLVKDGRLNDLVSSVNPLNVQVKLARATGLVSGTFSLWSENEAGTAQKEITGFKHNGVLVLSRDAFAPLSEEVAAAGFCYRAVKVAGVNPSTGRATSRNWTFSLPFNLLAVDQGEPDWWADDWGEQD